MKTEEEKKHIEKKIFDIARQNLQTTGADRPEMKWPQERELRTGTESLKIRYWRTGRYTPVNREQCLRLAGALELTEEEKRFLIQGYFDRSEAVYDTPKKMEQCSLHRKVQSASEAGGEVSGRDTTGAFG